MHYTDFRSIPKLNRHPAYACDVYWGDLENWISSQGDRLNDDPDFQRAYVWDLEQKINFIEFCLQGGVSGRNLYWNCKYYLRGENTPIELVDGKQRLNAVREFLAGKFPAFGNTYWSDIAATASFADHCVSFRMNILDMERAEMLRWYIFMNEGGVAHLRSDLVHARHLLEEIEDD